MFKNPIYRTAFNMLIIFSLFQFSVADYVTLGTTSNALLPVLLIAAVVTNLIFLVDLVAHFVGFGFGEMMKNHKRLSYEIILQLYSIKALYLACQHDYQDKLKAMYDFCLIFLFRTLRLMYLL